MTKTFSPHRQSVVVLAGGFDQIDLIDALKRRGLRVVVVDYHANPPAAAHADTHHRASTLDAVAVRRIVEVEGAALLTTACTDQALMIVAEVCEQLGLPSPFSAAAARRLTNKRWMKEHLRAWDIPTSPFAIVSDATDSLPDGLVFPVICKPVDANSSKGVTRADSTAGFGHACAQARAASRSGEVLCEAYLEGAELSIDAFVIDGRAHVLMVSESIKLPNNEGAFPIQRSIRPSAAAIRLAPRIEAVVTRIAQAFGIDNSPMIVQAIATADELYVLELSARIAGGAKHRYIRAATGYDVMGAYVDTLFAQRPPAPPPDALSAHPQQPLHVMQYLYARPGIIDRLAGFEALRTEGTIIDFFPTKTAGMAVGAALDSSNRVASVLLSATDQFALNAALQRLFTQARVFDPDGHDLLLRPRLPGQV